MQKEWVVLGDCSMPDGVAEVPDVHPALLQLLATRGVSSREQVEAFLSPNYERDVHPPSVFVRMGKAVERVFLALDSGEKIVIHGDYDADGVCGAALLYSTLKEVVQGGVRPRSGTDTEFSQILRQVPERYPSGTRAGSDPSIDAYIPDRVKDGYGVAMHTVERLAHEGAKLLITVDCGISNYESIKRAKELGLDTIVCDHHTLGEHLPDAILLHPLIPDETYPNKHLCGTGVASKLAWGLLDEGRRRGADFAPGFEKWLLDLVAIATVTDVMPLLGENRALEHFGLQVLAKTRREGLRQLMRVASTRPDRVSTWSIGWQIGPRLNAAGRMGDARAAFDLLVETGDLEASVRAVELNLLNLERQKASDALSEEARVLVQTQLDEPMVIVHGQGWSHGLIGLVAGKLLTEFGKPVFVATENDGVYVGSGRSVPGVHLADALRAGEAYYEKCGGHPEACGFTVRGRENFERAMAAAKEHVREQLQGASTGPRIQVDLSIKLDDIDWRMVDDLKRLEPFGKGHPEPRFLSKRVQIGNLTPVGNGQHVRLNVLDKGGDQSFTLMAFRRPELLNELSVGGIIDIVYEMGVNEWNGSRSIQLTLVDWRPNVP